MDRREIRKNVTQALTSLPVSSLLDLDQMTSALLQSTVGKRPVEPRILTRECNHTPTRRRHLSWVSTTFVLCCLGGSIRTYLPWLPEEGSGNCWEADSCPRETGKSWSIVSCENRKKNPQHNRCGFTLSSCMDSFIDFEALRIGECFPSLLLR